MSDITKCSGFLCPLRETCYRYLAPTGTWQSYFLGVPYENGECNEYWEIKKENDDTI